MLYSDVVRVHSVSPREHEAKSSSFPINDEKIRRVSYGENLSTTGRLFVGYKIETTNHEVVVAIEQFQSCCERYEVEMIYDNKIVSESNFLLGKIIEKVYFCHQLPKKYDNMKNDQDFRWAHVVVRFEDGEDLHIMASNYHNGYYPHQLWTKWKNRTEEEWNDIQQL